MEIIGLVDKNLQSVNPYLESLAKPEAEQTGQETQAGQQPLSDTATISEQAMAIQRTRSGEQDAAPEVAPEVNESAYDTPTAAGDGQLRVASRAEGEGDAASFSGNALDALDGQIDSLDKMTASQVVTTLDDGNGDPTIIEFNNKNGAITWNGNRLDLSGFANTLKDDVVVKNNGGLIEVYNLSSGQKMILNSDGTQQKKTESWIRIPLSRTRARP